MFISGTNLENDTFNEIYSIFDNMNDLQNWQEIINHNSIKLEIKQYNNLFFPFIIIEQFIHGKNNYKIINKDEFKIIVDKLDRKGDSEELYFILWRINSNSYNNEFPNEPCLRGIDEHLHFDENNILELESKGLDKYWDDILKEVMV
jgi:hypothetical protein